MSDEVIDAESLQTSAKKEKSFLFSRKTSCLLSWLAGFLVAGMIAVIVWNAGLVPTSIYLPVFVIAILLFSIARMKDEYPNDEHGKIQEMIEILECEDTVKARDFINSIFNEFKKFQDCWDSSLSKISMWGIAGILVIRYAVFYLTNKNCIIDIHFIDINILIILILLSILLLSSISTPVILLFLNRIDLFAEERNKESNLERICYNIGLRYVKIGNYISFFSLFLAVLASISLFIDFWRAMSH